MARAIARRPRLGAAGLPEWIRPQLTQLVDAAPDGPEWLHEIKFDGYRMHARLDRGAVRLLTRTGLDWTHKYPAIAAALASLGAHPMGSVVLTRVPSESALVVQSDGQGPGLALKRVGGTVRQIAAGTRPCPPLCRPGPPSQPRRPRVEYRDSDR
jgi:hypothetical protein